MVLDMAKVKTYEFWFCTSIFCKVRKNIKRVHWWSKPILLALYTVTAKCKFKAIDITDEDALKIAKIEFEEDGYYEEVMGIMV